ncbi:MAG: hypothetical protein ABIH82_02185 [Candidatus Woesearchaeota archaeon]
MINLQFISALLLAAGILISAYKKKYMWAMVLVVLLVFILLLGK